MKNKIKEIAWSLYGKYAWDQNQNNKVAEFICARIINTLNENKRSSDEKVLDAGCGTGYYAAKMCTAGFNITAIDYAKGMIENARRRMENNLPNRGI